MTTLDAGIIVLYFGVVIGLGLWYKKRASRSLDSYFLGEKKFHWLLLAMSGSVSNFDITGTMWIVSTLFVLGMKSMWHHWMWGFLMGAFFLAAYALMAILTLASFIGYAFQGIGKFASVYIPLESLASKVEAPWIHALLTEHKAAFLAIIIIGITTLYVVLGGLFSVVITDVVQTIVLTLSSLIIAAIAWTKLTPDFLVQLPEDFASLHIPWRLSEFAGTENAQFEFFGAIVIIWVLKGLLMNAGGPGQMYDFQRFLAARDDRDAAKVGASWSAFLIVRWAMVMGIALLALTGVLGVVDSEKVMPLVLRDFLPVGIRGIVIAGLLAAFMSTFSSTVNSGASFIVRDIWQPYFRPRASEKQAVRFSYLATILLVVLGLSIGFQSQSIAQIWNWMMVTLGAGIVLPNVLRWYWWRMNGWGYAWGTLGGMFLSTLALFFDTWPPFVVFPLIVTASLLLSIFGSLLTRPVEQGVLISFYQSVRPFGFWKPIKEISILAQEDFISRSENVWITILNVLLGMVAIAAFYLFPMYLVGHWYESSFICFGIGLTAVFVLRFTWYRNLPGADRSRSQEM
jgi:SSS family solute:Na+ symporter